MSALTIILASLFLTYLAGNLVIWAHNISLFQRKADYTQGGSLLVVVAHQDDETAVAGGAMLKTLAKGGSVHVVYLADGTVRSDEADPIWVQQHIETREREALACLKSIGVTPSTVHFLRNRNEVALRQPKHVNEAITRIEEFIRDINPYAVITCAFEGGHSDHDMTNYIVANACRNIGYPATSVYEAPEYSRYHVWDVLASRFTWLFLIKCVYSPRFIPGANDAYILEMSSEELNTKRDMFRHFVLFDPPHLIHMFGHPDRFRVIEKYDYCRGPYSPYSNARYWIGKFMPTRAEDFRSNVLNIGRGDYARIYGAIDKHKKSCQCGTH